MKPGESSTSGNRKRRGGGETESDRRARLASFAITRGQIVALRRHLEAGLDPDSLFHDGFSGPRPWPLIERALMMDQFDCCVVLEDAGATLTRHILELAICHCGDDRYLSRLIASGKLDLDGGPEPGVSWIDFAEHEETGASKRLLLQALCERERAALDGEPAPPAQTAQRRFL